jgi:hypothetical protein
MIDSGWEFNGKDTNGNWKYKYYNKDSFGISMLSNTNAITDFIIGNYGNKKLDESTHIAEKSAGIILINSSKNTYPEEITSGTSLISIYPNRIRL